MAQIYNRICDGYGDAYDKSTIREVQKYASNKNKAIQKEIEVKYNQDYLTDSDKRWVQKLKEQLRDESIFEQFEFLKNEADDNWGEPIDFTIEEMLDMPVMGDEICEQNNSSDNESHGNNSHGIFCVTGKDSDHIDIEDLY